MNLGRKSVVAGVLSVAMLGGGVAVAGSGITFKPKGDNVQLKCKGGMSSHAQLFQAGMLVFDGDPEVTVEVPIDYEPDGFRVEAVGLGTHAGTHIDVPSHFIKGTRSVSDLNADEFVWPVYVIDVRGISDFTAQLTIEDVKAYEEENGRIERGSLVVIQTGLEDLYVEPLPIDAESVYDAPFFADGNPGFAGATVQWMFDERHIAGTGSDAYGPDASSDELFDATYTTLLNNGVAVVVLNNLDDLAVRGDLLIAPPVNLSEGTGFPVNPISCQGKKSAPRTAMNFDFPSVSSDDNADVDDNEGSDHDNDDDYSSDDMDTDG